MASLGMIFLRNALGEMDSCDSIDDVLFLAYFILNAILHNYCRLVYKRQITTPKNYNNGDSPFDGGLISFFDYMVNNENIFEKNRNLMCCIIQLIVDYRNIHMHPEETHRMTPIDQNGDFIAYVKVLKNDERRRHYFYRHSIKKIKKIIHDICNYMIGRQPILGHIQLVIYHNIYAINQYIKYTIQLARQNNICYMSSEPINGELAVIYNSQELIDIIINFNNTANHRMIEGWIFHTDNKSANGDRVRLDVYLEQIKIMFRVTNYVHATHNRMVSGPHL